MHSNEHPLEKWLAVTGLSQRKLAAKAGLDPSTLSRYMAGERGLSPDAARSLRDVTGLSLDAIYEPVAAVKPARSRGSVSRAMGEGMTAKRAKGVRG